MWIRAPAFRTPSPCVSEAEAIHALAAPGEDGGGAAGSRLASGRSEAGRILRVIYAPDPDAQGLFVITAHPLGSRPFVP